MSTWIAVAVSTLVVVALRAGSVVGAAHIRLPRWWARVSGAVAPATTAALVAPRVLAPVDGAALAPDLLAFLLAIPVAVRTRSVGWTLAVGMPMLWITRALW